MTTFWKIEEPVVSEKSLLINQKIEPLGEIEEVSNKLLSIPNVRPYFDVRIASGNVAVIWEKQNTLLYFKEEPEFGTNEVFSLQAEKIKFEIEFFKLYVQIYEVFGCMMLHENKFVSTKDFRKMVYLP